jgi:hypothetical protein
MDIVIKERIKNNDSGEDLRKFNSVFVFVFYRMSSPNEFDKHYQR